jgi:hypothetical protein
VAVKGRPVDRHANVDLGRMVVHHIKPAGGQCAAGLLRADVGPNKTRTPGDVLLVPARQVVQYDDVPLLS